MMKRSLWIVLLAVLLLTLPAGCGGAPMQRRKLGARRVRRRAGPARSGQRSSAARLPGGRFGRARQTGGPPGRRTEPGSGGAPACGEQAVGDAGEP